MAIIKGHSFHPDHGFTGSAGKNAHASIPGYKRGGFEHEIEKAVHEHEDHEHAGHHTRLKLKDGGTVDHKDHYGKGSHVDHDGAMHQSHVHYDKHGFQHCAVGGKSAAHHAKKGDK